MSDEPNEHTPPVSDTQPPKAIGFAGLIAKLSTLETPMSPDLPSDKNPEEDSEKQE